MNVFNDQNVFMSNITEKPVSTISMFDHTYICGKSLYMHCFNKIPSVSYIGSIEGQNALNAFIEKYPALVLGKYYYKGFYRNEKPEFYQAMVVLNNECVLEFYSGNCQVHHSCEIESFVAELVAFFHNFKEKQRRKPLEINLIVRNGSYLELRAMEIKRTKLDLDLFYEDDFKRTDEIIRKRLGNKKDKGIVLLHGLPGTGKTTYLRHLVSTIKKRVLFLSPNIAGNLIDPEFVQLLINNPDSVLVIEDAENIIMDRRTNSNSSVSNLLNISDGLLADFLNVQVICTFNNALTLVDSALMRKGRMIAKYEFGKLGVAKSQRLSDHLGFDTVITKPMTVAEIANQHEDDQNTKQVETIGFRRNYLEN